MKQLAENDYSILPKCGYEMPFSNFQNIFVVDAFSSVYHFFHVYAAETVISMYYVKVEVKHYTSWRCDCDVVCQDIKRG